MEIFDCNACFGVFTVPPPAFAETAEELLEEMAFCGIHRALVTIAAMREESPIVGNALVVEALRDFDDLYPSWAILPPQTGEVGSPDALVARMKEQGVRVLWAFPSEHKYLLNGTTFGSLFEVMIERRIPLFLSLTENSGGLGGWALVDAVLRDFPRLRLVVTDHGCWGQDRYFRPLVERYDDVYIDTARFELDGGIADFCRAYGPDRLLFGTGYPRNNMGGALLTVAHADIREKEREAILGGNLERLLGEVRL